MELALFEPCTPLNYEFQTTDIKHIRTQLLPSGKCQLVEFQDDSVTVTFCLFIMQGPDPGSQPSTLQDQAPSLGSKVLTMTFIQM